MLAALVAVVGLSSTPQTARADANVIYVGLGETGVGGSCESPDHGVASYPGNSEAIQAALDEANADPAIDTVHICDGHTLASTLQLGGHADVTIEGDADSSVLNGDNLTQLIYACERDDARFTIRDITLTGGLADDWGGAIKYQGTLILDGVEVSENHAPAGGGAIDNCGNGNDALEIYDSTFAVNTSDGVGSLGGGAVLNWGGSVLVEGSTFVDNSIDAEGAFANVGGAIYANLVVIRGSTFEGNEAGDDAGAIFAATNPGDGTLDAGSIDVSSSRFISNISGDDGGALHAEGPVTVRGSWFNANRAVQDGGAIVAKNGIDVRSSQFTSNETEAGGGGDGGAIWAAGLTTVVSSMFVGNRALDDETGEGGAINVEDDCDGGIVRSSRFEENHAAWSGGAINFNDCAAEQRFQVLSSRFTSNSTGYSDGGAIDVDISTEDPTTWLDLTVRNSRFIRNVAARDGADDLVQGGAIWMSTGTVQRNTFVRNSAPTCGGAVYRADGDDRVRFVLRKNVFRANRSDARSSLRTVCWGT